MKNDKDYSDMSSDYSDDDDPDKIEVPGGGKTIDSVKLNMEAKAGTSSQCISSMNQPAVVKEEPISDGNQYGATKPIMGGTSFNHLLRNDGGMLPYSSPYDSLLENFSALSEVAVNPLLALLAANPTALQYLNPAQFNAVMMQKAPMSRSPGIDLAKLWGGYNKKLKPNLLAPAQPPFTQQPEPELDDAVEDEDMGVAETYADYRPSKLKFGKRHPDQVVETASLASVLPPEVYYKLKLPSQTIDTGSLSALQLEAIVYACQQHEHFLQSGERGGYLIGDGAGVGKGRTIAGIIYENFLSKRKKSIWVSVSADLKYDSERDLSDIGARIPVIALNKLKYGRFPKMDMKEGVIFSTYSSLIGESSQTGKYNTRLKQILDWCGKDFDGVIVFDECHRAKNLCPVGSAKPTKTGITVHELQKQLPKARVVYASATGASEPKNMAYMTRLGIWGPGTPFREFGDFINAVEKRGIGAMEIVAMDMKLRGTYIARQLSFNGVTFNIDEVPLDPMFIKVYDESVELWVDAMNKFIEAAELMQAEARAKKAIWAQFWSAHQRFFKYLCIASKVKKAIEIASDAVKCGKCVVIGLQSTGEARTLDQLERDDGELSDFVSTAKGVFQALIEKHFPASNKNKVNELLGKAGHKVETQDIFKVIKPSSSGGSSGSKRKPVRQAAQKAVKRVKKFRSNSEDEKESDSDFEESGSSSSESYESDEEASNEEFEASDIESDEGDKKKNKGKEKIRFNNSTGIVPSKEAVARACELKEELLQRLEHLGERLPPNTLDQLIDELGGPENVAEMTGRKGRVVQTEDGKIEYEHRSEADISLETINLAEKQRFMDGKKDIAIISEAASSGISLQSDRRVANQRRRVHITLELPWSADRAIQQFGRTHRSNQVNAPEYVFLISDLAGEHRFASIVAKRLESLGALTHGDRRATESRDLSRFHIDNKYGRLALEHVMKYIMGYEINPPVKPSPEYQGNFRTDMAAGLVGVGLIVNSEDSRGVPILDKDYGNISKFLNRILGMPVKLQNALFHYFVDMLNAVITQAKKTGRYDMGILDLGDPSSGKVTSVSTTKFLRKHATGQGVIEMHCLSIERGMSWEESREKYSSLERSHEGYYQSKLMKNGKRTAVLVMFDPSSEAKKGSKDKKRNQVYCIWRPSTGLQVRRETLKELQMKYKPCSADEAQPYWEDQYRSSERHCIHAFWSGNCKNRIAGYDCDVGLRKRTYHVLTGAVLLVWDEVERILATHSISAKMQIVRTRIEQATKIVGLLIPNSCAEKLKEMLEHEEEKAMDDHDDEDDE